MSQQDLPSPVLAPCPFCGGGAVVSADMTDYPSIACDACGATGPGPRAPGIEEATRCWNIRRPSPRAEMQGGEMAEALEAARRIVEADEALKSARPGVDYRERAVCLQVACKEDGVVVARALLSTPKDASRDDVLEEAAKVAERYAADLGQFDHWSVTEGVVKPIRALKEKPHG